MKVGTKSFWSVKPNIFQRLKLFFKVIILKDIKIFKSLYMAVIFCHYVIYNIVWG